MIPRYLLVQLAAIAYFAGAPRAEGAIFRIQSRVNDSGPTPTYSYGSATFEDGSLTTYQISGEFRYSTDYSGPSGDVTNELTAWNISLTGPGINYRYSYGYDTPALGSVSNTSFRTLDYAGPERSFYLRCDNNPACDTSQFLGLKFASDFNTTAGDSNGISSSNFNVLDEIHVSLANNAFYADSQGSLSGQADFVPFSIGLFCLAPVAFLTRRLKRPH